jgi:hypothetical protein
VQIQYTPLMPASSAKESANEQVKFEGHNRPLTRGCKLVSRQGLVTPCGHKEQDTQVELLEFEVGELFNGLIYTVTSIHVPAPGHIRASLDMRPYTAESSDQSRTRLVGIPSRPPTCKLRC